MKPIRIVASFSIKIYFVDIIICWNIRLRVGYTWGFQKTRAFFNLFFNRSIISQKSFSGKGLESARAIQLCGERID
jgi:hypothetical protein